MKVASLAVSVVVGLMSGAAAFKVSYATRLRTPGACRRAAKWAWWASATCFTAAVFRGIIGAVWLGLFAAACWVAWLAIARLMREMESRSARSA